MKPKEMNHHSHCWRDHHGCAVARLEGLENRLLDGLNRMSELHDAGAWQDEALMLLAILRGVRPAWDTTTQAPCWIDGVGGKVYDSAEEAIRDDAGKVEKP